MERTFISTINEVWDKVKTMGDWDCFDNFMVEDLVTRITNFENAARGQSLFQTSVAEVERSFTLVAYRIMELDPMFNESDEYNFMLDCLAEFK